MGNTKVYSNPNLKWQKSRREIHIGQGAELINRTQFSLMWNVFIEEMSRLLELMASHTQGEASPSLSIHHSSHLQQSHHVIETILLYNLIYAPECVSEMHSCGFILFSPPFLKACIKLILPYLICISPRRFPPCIFWSACVFVTAVTKEKLNKGTVSWGYFNILVVPFSPTSFQLVLTCNLSKTKPLKKTSG